MTISPELAAELSAKEAPPRAVNERFREYVQSTAFSLSLGRTHISALTMLEHGIDRGLEIARWPIDIARIAQLQRRGLVVDLQPEVSKPAFQPRPQLWVDHYQITVAGKLTLALLAEAGIIAPKARRTLPPPAPPGWLDPRPKIRANASGVFQHLPSDRETGVAE